MHHTLASYISKSSTEISENYREISYDMTIKINDIEHLTIVIYKKYDFKRIIIEMYGNILLYGLLYDYKLEVTPILYNKYYKMLSSVSKYKL